MVVAMAVGGGIAGYSLGVGYACSSPNADNLCGLVGGIRDRAQRVSSRWGGKYCCDGTAAVPIHLHTARDGEQALLVSTNPHVHLDLIILDLNLPYWHCFAATVAGWADTGRGF